MRKVKNDFINELAKTLPKKNVDRAIENAANEIFMIRLAELRRRRGIKQDEIKSFSQSSISKLESRKDMKLSTLIEYLSELGMGIEIKTYPKTEHTKGEELILVKV